MTAAAPTSARIGEAGTAYGFIGSALGWIFDGYETYATVLVSSAIIHDLAGGAAPASRPFYVSGILAVTLVAWATGGLLSGVLADRFGRRRVLMYSILWYSACSGLTALAPSYGSFLAFRFLTGLGMGAEWGAGSSLVSEVVADRYRGRGIALLQSSFGVGFLLAAIIWQLVDTGGPGAWRGMYLIGAVPALVTLFVRRRVRDPRLWVEVDGKRRRIRAEVAGGRAVAPADRQMLRATMAQLLQTPLRRRRVAMLLVAALSTTMGWWAVSSWIPLFTAQQLAGKVGNVPRTVTVVVVAYNVAGLAGYLMMGVLADWLGRKPAMMVYFAGALVAVPLLFLGAASPRSFVLLASVNGFFTMGQWTWIALYPGELFPTRMRATALAFIFNLTRFIVAGGTLASAAAIHFFGSIGIAATVIGSGYVLGLLFTPWIGPETRGRPLPTDEDAPDAAPTPFTLLATERP